MSYHFANPVDIFRFQHRESSKAVSFGALFFVYDFSSQKIYMAMLFAEHVAALLSKGDLMVLGTRILGNATKTLTSSSGWVYGASIIVPFTKNEGKDGTKNMVWLSPSRKRICCSNRECVSASLNKNVPIRAR